MKFQKIITALEKNTSLKLPDDGSKRGAVIMPIFERNKELYVLFTKRTEHLNYHKGQISFPGGKQDETDESLYATGLRETYEEIGIKPERLALLGELNQIKTNSSNVLLSTFVCRLEYPFCTRLNADEVEEIIIVPLKELMNDKKWQKGGVKTSEGEITTWFFDFDPHVIWGATAKLVKMFLKLL